MTEVVKALPSLPQQWESIPDYQKQDIAVNLLAGGAFSPLAKIEALKALSKFAPKSAPPLTNVRGGEIGSGVIGIRAKQGGLTGKINGDDLFIDIYQVYDDYLGQHFGTSLIREAIERAPGTIKSVSGKLGGTNWTKFQQTGDIWSTPIGRSMRELGFNDVFLEGTEFIFRIK